MIDSSTSLTVAASTPEPYVHLDNRGLVISNGPRCVKVPASSFRFAAETFEIIAAEDRATRHQHDHVLGGSSPASRWCCSAACATTWCP